MSFMNALDLDAQEAIHAIDGVSAGFIHDWIDGKNAGLSEAEIEQGHRLKMVDALQALGWVPPTIAEEADRRVRTVIDGNAESIATTLIGASALLRRPALPELVMSEVAEEPLAEWERELLNLAAEEARV